MPVYLAIVWAVVFGALVGAIYVGLGGRALFGTRERPQRILGQRVYLRILEDGPNGAADGDSNLPPAVVEQYTPTDQYLLRFEGPVLRPGGPETHARVAARYVGYSVSMAAGLFRRRITVTGRFNSGEAFIGVLKIASAGD